MNVAARAIATPILRSASGEPPLGPDGLSFRADQGEMMAHEHQGYQSPSTRIGVLEIEDGSWLSFPFGVDRELFETREAALRSGIAGMVRKARAYIKTKEGEGTHWSEGHGHRIIEWALSLKPVKEVLVQVATAVAEAPIDHPVSEIAASNADRVIEDSSSEHSGSLRQPTTSDPIVRSLVESKRSRKTYPANHTFSMTNPIVNGNMVTLGTCTCGHSFSYAYGSYERMDAAIEAHWQSFDRLAEKIDGRGNPINAVTEKPKRKPKSRPGAGGHPAPIASAPPHERTTTGADATLSNIADGTHPHLRSEPAPSAAPPAGVGAGSNLSGGSDDVQTSDPFWDSPLIKAALELAWREPQEVTPQLKALLDFSKVYAAPKDVTRPLLRWHGGKWKLAPWVMGFFPEHRIYVEPFGGAGSVLMRKPRVYAEVYNDLDDVVVNLFRVLRDDAKAARLINALRLTPFSRDEFTDALLEAEDDVERARHLIVRSYMGFGSNAHSGSAVAEKTGFKSFTRPDEYRSTGFRANSTRSGTTPAHDWANYPDVLPAIIDRLRGVIVEQRPAIDVMRQHDGEMTLHYVDPPYLPETRSPANKYDLKHRMYRHELSVEDHHELLEFLKTLRGFVVLSGYPADQYDQALPDWRRETCAALADGARERTEVVWINPACAAALDQKHPTLFNIAALDAVNVPPPRRKQHDGRG